MAEATTGENAPTIDVTAITKSVTDAVLAAVNPTLVELGKNQKVLADTFAAQATQSQDGTKADDKSKLAATPQQALTAEQVTKLVADGIAAAQRTAQQSAEQTAAREAFVKSDTSGLAKLPARFQAGLGNDPTKWGDEAKAITKEWEAELTSRGVKIPDVGGANREGGDATGGAATATAKTGGFLKMPGATATAAAA